MISHKEQSTKVPEASWDELLTARVVDISASLITAREKLDTTTNKLLGTMVEKDDEKEKYTKTDASSFIQHMDNLLNTMQVNVKHILNNIDRLNS